MEKNSMSTVLVVSDAHLFKTPDGRYWCNTAMHGYQFWKRYLSSFDDVIVVARTKDISINEKEENNYIRADGENISVFALPFVRGLMGYLFRWPLIKKKCDEAATLSTKAIFRIPSIPAYMLLKKYLRTRNPYAVEVVIDPEDEYRNIPILKSLSSKILKNVCASANGVSYVTQDYLEKKYPSGKRLGKTDKKYFESYYSSIDLTTDFFFYNRSFNSKYNKIHLLHITNSINNENKGHRALINIVSKLRKIGIEAPTVFVGSGDKIDEFKELSAKLEVDDIIEFVGYVSDKKIIRNYLESAELFVFPSKAEGLPRVLIEAMATGLPCLASNVDGIPELLDQEFLFDPNDVEGFKNKIVELAGNNTKLAKMGMNNLKKAGEYAKEVLDKRRSEFYDRLKLV